MTLSAEIKKYSRDVVKGRILACQKHKWACQRFLDDLKRQGKRDFPYRFNEKKAEKFLSWIRLFKHSKGKLKGQNIEPHIIQKFIFGNVYGWEHKKTGYRRFTKIYWQVARKNAKTQSCAAVGTYELAALDESGIEVMEIYCAATKSEQARVAWNEAEIMIRQAGFVGTSKPFRVAYNKIIHKKTGGFMRALSKEDRRTGDALNPQCSIVDEYHAHETAEIYDVLDSGMGARTQPLMVIITTAGFNLNNPCYRVEYDLVSRLLDPESDTRLDWYFAMVNELDHDSSGNLTDDIYDHKAWPKANPIICSYPEGRAYLKKKADEARETPDKMRNFLTKHLNVWVQMREQGYMQLSDWKNCMSPMPDMRGQRCFIGVDLSAKIDLTSLAFEFPIDDRYVIFTHSFMPENTLQAKERTDAVPYGQWVKEGWITLTPGAVVDYRFVMEWALEEVKKRGWKPQEWCIDPHGATQLSGDLIERGYDVTENIQNYTTLSEPTKDFREMVISDRVIHDGNPVTSFAVSNAIVRMGPSENILLDKRKSKQRIDPLVAIINAHVRAMVKPKKSVYEERGMRML